MEFIIVSVLLIATASFVGGWALVSFHKAELHYGTYFHTNTQQQSDIEEIDSQKIFESKISLLDKPISFSFPITRRTCTQTSSE